MQKYIKNQQSYLIHSFTGKFVQLIGFAMEEKHRALSGRFHGSDKTNVTEWKFPLLENNLDRDDCIQLIKAEGLTVPRKSGCFFCPFQRLAHWEDLYKHYPELYAKAEFLEQNAKRKENSISKHKKIGNNTVNLIPSGISLAVSLMKRANE